MPAPAATCTRACVPKCTQYQSWRTKTQEFCLAQQAKALASSVLVTEAHVSCIQTLLQKHSEASCRELYTTNV